MAPRQDLDRLVERADAARQHRKSIGALGHDPFPLMHIGNDHQLAEAAMRDLAMFEMDGDDPGRLAAARQHRIGDAPHQPIASAAIDKRDAAGGKPGAELGRRRGVARIGAARGAAIDAKPLDPHRGRPIDLWRDAFSSSEQGTIASRLATA